MSKINLRKWAAKLHLWLGLPSGVVLFIVAITGAIYALQPEVADLGRPKFHIEPKGEILRPSELIERVRPLVFRSDADSTNAIYGVTYRGYLEPAVVGAKVGKSRHSGYYMNPYTGELLHEEHPGYNFFRWAITGHRTLWLPREIGKPIIGWSILTFVFVTITGLIMWLPRKWNKKSIKAATTIKWASKPSKRWLDVHNVVGFYTAIFALAIAITGLTWSFDWWGNGYYSLLTGGDTLEKWSMPSSDTLSTARPYASPDSVLWERALKKYPLKDDGSSLRFDVPSTPDGVFAVVYNPDGDLAYADAEYNFYDRYTLTKLKGGGLYGIEQDSLSFGQKLYRMNYDIHSGSIAGTLGRYVAMLVSLLLATLPITGGYLYLRRFKGKKS